jgi:hypothetical protein
MMIIRFTKGKKGKPDTLACVREDGSSTWEPSQVGIRHDLIHYAVETVLGYKDAFFGLVAGGRDISDFGTKNGKKDTYTAQEAWAEHIVGLLQWPSVAGGPALSPAEFLDMLTATQAASGTPVPTITTEQLVQIRSLVDSLHARWAALPPGNTLEVEFTPNEDTPRL